MTTTKSIMLILGLAAGTALAADYPIRSAELTKTRVTGGFWFDRLETNRTATLTSCLKKCNETPRIANFTNAANRARGKFGGIPFDDSDVYKVMEGAAYVLAQHPDRELEKYVDWFIGEVAKAQEPDGYLYTARTMGFYFYGPTNEYVTSMMGPTRWSNVSASHELYNVGHMYEAAVAWKQATGKDNFLAVAKKSADLVNRVFGPEPTQLKDAPGHEEIELALGKLYRITQDARYLKLAKFLLDTRGHGVKIVDEMPAGADGKPVKAMGAPNSYNQNHLPVVLQREAVGHAVRAGYLYSGMADIAALTGDRSYLKAIDVLWENVVGKKLHLTGGIGARPHGEAFGEDYELPNDGTYLETCAAIANALWNDRLFRFHGEAKYVDVLERTLYNGFLSGISLSGDEYFYPNPLASKGGYKRSKWFGCSCCPVNDVRFIPQIPSLAYATNGSDIYWNLFMKGEAEVNGIALTCDTDYPWCGKMTLKIGAMKLRKTPKFALKVRIPGWAKGQPVPSDLYVQTKPSSVMEVSLTVNGLAVNGVPGKDGYLSVERTWATGDTVVLDLPMPVKRIRAHEKVAADKGRLAVERGPIVYCAEGVDNGGKAFDAVLPEDATFADDQVVIGDKTFPALKASNGLKLIPYCIWGNREPGNNLECWFRTK